MTKHTVTFRITPGNLTELANAMGELAEKLSGKTVVSADMERFAGVEQESSENGLAQVLRGYDIYRDEFRFRVDVFTE